MGKKSIVWVINGDSESGDHYQEIFKKKPTEKQLDELAHKWDGWQCYMCEGECICPMEDRGPGRDGSYVYLEVEMKEIL